MAPTRANVETELVKRASSLMTFVGMAVTVAGSNADLVSPIAYGVRITGGTVASIAAVTDADIATVDSAYIDALLDYAEYRLLLNIQGNFDEVTTKAGDITQDFSDLLARLEKRLDGMKDRLDDEHGFGGATMEAGTLGHDFADHNEALADEE